MKETIPEFRERIKQLEAEIDEYKDELDVTRQMKKAHWESYKKVKSENQRLTGAIQEALNCYLSKHDATEMYFILKLYER